MAVGLRRSSSQLHTFELSLSEISCSRTISTPTWTMRSRVGCVLAIAYRVQEAENEPPRFTSALDSLLRSTYHGRFFVRVYILRLYSLEFSDVSNIGRSRDVQDDDEPATPAAAKKSSKPAVKPAAPSAAPAKKSSKPAVKAAAPSPAATCGAPNFPNDLCVALKQPWVA